MTTRPYLWILLVLSSALPIASLPGRGPLPNFIVIMADDMGYEGPSCFGNPYFKTPELDRLAAEGMRLTDFHSSSCVCSPTRAGLLTGRYQQRAGIEAVIHPRSDHPEHRKGLQLSETTVAELLKESGYTTGMVGKWHLGYTENSEDFHPQNHGFDEFTGYHSGNIDYSSHVGDHYKHDWWHGKEEKHEEGYTTHLVNKYAEEFVRKHAGDDKPFYLYIAHQAIHDPVQVPGDPVRRTLDNWDRWFDKGQSMASRVLKYKGMTLPLDEGIGRLRSLLFELDIADNTFVWFFSDNGAARDFPSGSPRFRGNKGSLYEGGHRVPAIAWWPGKIPAGTDSSAPVISIDVTPTLLSLAKAGHSTAKFDGVDISPVLFHRKDLPARPLYWAYLGNRGNRQEAMRDGAWKLVVNHRKAKPGTFGNETAELFDLSKDPGEKSDISGQHPAQVAKMLNQLKAWYADCGASAPQQQGGWLE